MTDYRPACEKPCGECPFRRKSAAGWLGAATPESFIIEISYEKPLPCHMSIDYEDPAWQRKWSTGSIGRICAGSLIMTANMAKLPRDPAFPRMKADHQLVFSNPREFIEHHRASAVRSWEFGDDAEKEIRTPIDRFRQGEAVPLEDFLKAGAFPRLAAPTGGAARNRRARPNRRVRAAGRKRVARR